MLGIMKNMPEIFTEQIDNGDIWSAMIPYINGTMKFMEEMLKPGIFSVDGKNGMQKVVEIAAVLMIADEARKIRKVIEGKTND